MFLRRSLAVAASSRCSRAYLAPAAVCTCRTSSHAYTTSAPLYRSPSASYSPKYGARSDRGGKGSSRPPFKPQYKRKPFVFDGFALPEPPTGQEIARKLLIQTRALFENGQVNAGSEQNDIGGIGARLVAYGLKGRAAEMLLYAKSDDKDVLGNYDPASDARALFEIWAAKLLQELPRTAIEYDARKHPDATDSAPPESSASGSDEPGDVVFGPIDDAVTSYSIEGDKCLSRYCLTAFLDWVEVGLTDLLSPTAPFRAVSIADQVEVNLVLSQLRLLRNTTDLRNPTHRYGMARTLTRQVHLHVGPTNSGKTYGALVALSKARTGTFAGPLRLLAHEVWDRFNAGTISPGIPPRACNLTTGEEIKTIPFAGLNSCTVEMVSLSSPVDVAVVDEIQMIADPQRGYAWTDAVLGIPAKELHLCGEASTIPLIKRMVADCGDVLHVHEYQRLTPLTIAQESIHNDLRQIKTGDCIVSFSRTGIFALKREIEQTTGLRCAVAYGALPPETKAEQAKLFNEGKLDVMVASDAIGMGLNLKIKRIVFDSMSKWNGKEQVSLSASQIKQIAGRAGRYGTKRDEDEVEGGIVTTRHEEELHVLRQALESPLRPVDRAAIQPSSETLASLAALLPPPKEPVTDVTKLEDVFAGPAAYSKRQYTKALKAATQSRTRDAIIEENRILRAMQGPGFRTLSEIYTDVAVLSRIEPATYFMSDFSQQHTISPIVEAASRNLLTVSERENFANAPANTRDERVMGFLKSAVRLFSAGGLVRFDACAQGSGMLEMEELTLRSVQEAADLRAQEMANSGQSVSPSSEQQPLASYLGQNHELLDASTLMLLESLHRSMSLYLWLSFRFPLSFCYREQVEQRKKAAEDGIEFVLEGIRFGRARRLRELGRTDEADNALQKPSWKQMRDGEASHTPRASGLSA